MGRQAGARVHGPADQLSRAERPRQSRRQGIADPRCEAGDSRRPLPSQHAALRHRVLRHHEGWRYRRELLAARCRAGARTQGRGQPDRFPLHARPEGTLSADGTASRQDAAEEAHRRRDRRNVRRTGHGARPDDQDRSARAGAERRSAHHLPAIARQRRPLSGLPHPRPQRDHCRPAIYRRHDRPAERRDADARQSVGGDEPICGIDANRTAGAAKKARSACWRCCRPSTSMR